MFKSLSISVPIQIAAAGATLLVVLGAVMLSRDPLPVNQTETVSQSIKADAPVPVTEPVTELVTEPAPVRGPVTEPVTEPVVEPSTGPVEAVKADKAPNKTQIAEIAPQGAVPAPVASESPAIETTGSATASPETTPAAPAEPTKDQGPSFDLVRVDSSGSAVIAGKAEPLSEVQVTFGAAPLETVRADRNGAFVALVQLPAGDVPQTMGLTQLRDGDGAALTSAQTVLVVPPQLDAVDATPTIVLADRQGASVLQASPPASPPTSETAPATQALNDIATHPLSLEAISYDQGGAVVLAGRGGGDKFVRVYVNNQPIETEAVLDDGNWRVVLPAIDQGVYTLRVDQISETGAVLSRIESPFKREAPAEVAAAAQNAPDKSTVVVQPGHTLWALAQDTYGDGVQYVQIFHANRDRIRNADLIYPGQVFDLPK